MKHPPIYVIFTNVLQTELLEVERILDRLFRNEGSIIVIRHAINNLLLNVDTYNM